MKIRRAACLVLYTDKKTIIIQDRINHPDPKGIKYGWFGGKAEDGETFEQGLVREAKEELNIDLKKYEFIGEYSYDRPTYKVTVKLFITKAPKNIVCSEGEPKEVTIEEAKKLIASTDHIGITKVEEWLNKNA
jgi:8-oxo-dGTP pyrophosphatase MutT (NUDIX family)